MARAHKETLLLSRRYGRALFELAMEQKTLSSVEKDLENLSGIVKNSPELREAFANPNLPRKGILVLINEASKKAKCGKLVVQFGTTLAENRRVDVLADIHQAFNVLVAEHKGEVTAQIRSANTLKVAQVKNITDKLEKATGKKVAAETEIAPELLGGVQIRLGSRLLDASIAGQLGRLELHLKQTQK